MTTTIQSNNAPVFASNVKTNFQNMSTVKKVALGLTAIALVGASVAAFVATPAVIAFCATTLSFAVSALAVQLTAGGLGALGLAIPAFALIGSPKKNQESAVEMEEIQAQEQPQGPSAEDDMSVELAPAPVAQSSLSSFAYNHRYLIAGAVIVTAAVLGGAYYLGKDGMKAQGQNLVDAGKKLPGQALSFGKNTAAQAYAKLPDFKAHGQNLFGAGKKLPGQAFNFGKNAFAQAYAKLPTFKK
jgi:hypothetical protein